MIHVSTKALTLGECVPPWKVKLWWQKLMGGFHIVSIVRKQIVMTAKFLFTFKSPAFGMLQSLVKVGLPTLMSSLN